MQTDEQLMLAYVAGDPSGFAELFRRYAPRLLGYFRRHGKREEDCRDLVQQTFLHVHRSRYDWKASEAVRPWLFTIARNAHLDQCRKQLRRPEHFADVDSHAAPAAPVTSRLFQAQRVRALTAALDRLSPRDRTLVDEHFWGESSFEEIALRDGMQSATLRVRAHRACARLRAWIDPAHAGAI